MGVANTAFLPRTSGESETSSDSPLFVGTVQHPWRLCRRQRPSAGVRIVLFIGLCFRYTVFSAGKRAVPGEKTNIFSIFSEKGLRFLKTVL